MTPRFHSLAIADLRRETPDAVSIAFAVPEALTDAYRFTPGQYLTLRATIDGEEMRRSYSICSGLDDGELRVAVKQIADGRFSSHVEHFAAGQTLDVMTPMGRFGIAPGKGMARRYLGLACGSGITPILSIVKSVLTREADSRFVLLYGNRTTQSILFREALEDLKDRFLGRFSVAHVLSREAQDVPALNGRLDAEKIALLLRSFGGPVDHAFICGPSAMLEDAETTLKNLGLTEDRIHIERFTPAEGGIVRPAPRIAETATPVAMAEITLDGAKNVVPVAEGEAILDAALRAGLDLPYSCRGGMCCTCRARIVEGSVEMAVNYSLEAWEMKAGFALTCQARPTSARVVVDYDAL